MSLIVFWIYIYFVCGMLFGVYCWTISEVPAEKFKLIRLINLLIMVIFWPVFVLFLLVVTMSLDILQGTIKFLE